MKKKPQNFTVSVFGKDVPIKFQPDTKVGEYPVFGYFDTENWTIHVDSNLSKEQTIETIIHEIGHAMMHRIYLAGVIDYNLSEIITEGFAKVITENFKLSKK